jgi:hypothetical protein
MRKLTLVEPSEAPPDRQTLPGIPATIDLTGTGETPTTFRDKWAQAERALKHCRAQETQAFLLRHRPWQRRP